MCMLTETCFALHACSAETVQADRNTSLPVCIVCKHACIQSKPALILYKYPFILFQFCVCIIILRGTRMHPVSTQHAGILCTFCNSNSAEFKQVSSASSDCLHFAIVHNKCVHVRNLACEHMF